MQLQRAGLAAKYRNICRREERGMHRRGGRNVHPFRAKRDAGTKTCALIQGGASGKARTTNEQRGKRLNNETLPSRRQTKKSIVTFGFGYWFHRSE